MTGAQSNEEANAIQFILNDELTSISNPAPTRSLLSYLRYDLGLVGSKEGCAEGDCGACTVVIGELINDQLQLRAVNACIQFIPTLDGKALYTVEYLRQANGELHPVQQAMVDCHGSQCGFCTPGFIMSLWNVYLDHQAQDEVADEPALRTALSGNLCRCTGYKPILQAGRQMFDYDKVTFDHGELKTRLKALGRDQGLSLQHGAAAFHSPSNLKELTQLRAEHPKAALLAGGTDVGLWVNKQLRDLGDIIYLGQVKELKQMQESGEHMVIGAGVSLNDAFALIAKHYPQISEQWERFASVPIRNAGTLGGNIANGSPIGDSMPWLIVIGAKVHLASQDGQRSMALEDLYLDYMKKSMRADEVVSAIEIPLPQAGQHFATYKLSKRYDSDISAVCAAFSIQLEGEKITAAKVAFGGMAATPKRAAATEAALINQPWNEQTATQAMSKLSTDYSPLADMRASAQNRALSAANLLYRFYLETRPNEPLSPDQLSVFASASPAS